MNRTRSSGSLLRSVLVTLTAIAMSATVAFASSGAVVASHANIGLASLSLYEAILPDIRDEIYAQTSDMLPIYDVSANFNAIGEQPASIVGTTQLAYVNFSDALQDEVYLRLYPNSSVYREGGIVLDEVLVDGDPIPPRYEHEDTLVVVPLEEPLEVGEVVDLTISFTSTIPSESDDSYGMFTYEDSGNSYNLAHWQPLIAGWTTGIGWNTDPINLRGDPVFTNSALFSVQMTAPSDLVFATTGMATETIELGAITQYTWESGPSRDFVMIANPDFQVLQGTVGNTVVRSFYSPDKEEVAAEVLDATMASLELFNELFGPYPYREFDLAEARIGPRAAGIEFPGLVYVSRTLYQPGNASLEFTIVHEVAHQWWYAVVGNNQHLYAFLDESLSNYTAILYIEARYGAEIAGMAVDRFLKRSYFAALFGNTGDQIVNQPTASFPSDSSYGRIVYGKGALGMQAIREEIGLDTFTGALKDYTAEHRFGIVLPDDLVNAFEQTSNMDLSELWRHWFEAAEGNQDFSPTELIEID